MASEYTLYYAPNTASLSSHWLLVELESCGVPHTLHRISFSSNEQKSPAYLTLNPKGRVPTLLIGDSPITEQVAIALTLAERHPEAGLAPGVGEAQRGKFIETLVYIANTLLPAMRDWVYAAKDGNPADAEGVRRLAKTRLSQAWDLLDKQLAGKEYLVGDVPTIVDFLGVAVAGWTKWHQELAMCRHNVRTWVERMRRRPSWAELVRRVGGWEPLVTVWEDKI
jgi:glutathione S-transferase